MQPISVKTKQKHREAVKLYEIMKTTPIEEYVSMLPDVNFVIDHIEYELARWSFSKNLWHFYVKFLKDQGRELQTLNVYSRYCRIFVEDKEMRDQYLVNIKALENKSINVKKWLIDYILIEKSFGSSDSEVVKSLSARFSEDTLLSFRNQRHSFCNHTKLKFSKGNFFKFHVYDEFSEKIFHSGLEVVEQIFNFDFFHQICLRGSRDYVLGTKRCDFSEKRVTEAQNVVFFQLIIFV